MSARLVSVMTTNRILALDGKPTKKCFTGWCYTFRGNFDGRLPIDQPPSVPCISTTLSFAIPWNPFWAAKQILGVNVEINARSLGKMIIESGYAKTLVQIEELVAKTECHEKTGLIGRSFFFIETKNQEEPVAVGSVARYGTGWYARIYAPEDCRNLSVLENLLVCNFDASGL